MSDNIVLDHLRHIRTAVDGLRDDVRDVKHRLTSLEAQVALLHGDLANQSLRIDRISDRLDRIERRFDIVEA